MPTGQMLALSPQDMPKVDMNAAVRSPTEGVMPQGRMAATASDEMPSGAMEEADDVFGQAQQDMPTGSMLSDVGTGMPSGSMLSDSVESDVWDLDVSAAQSCGCT